ncbi:MAG: MBL fold metallo-hydrolase [Candidatus Marsarchaeota archaeon]
MADLVFAVYRIPIEQVGGNSYVVIRGEDTLVIDTGTPGNASKILSQLEALNRKLSAIILTHCHADHAGSAADLKEATGAELYVGEKDAAYVSGQLPLPLPPRAQSSQQPRADFTYKPVKPDHLLKEGDLVFGFRVLSLPGHTPGSVALYDGRSLFSGDNMNNRQGGIQGTPEAYDWDHEQAKKSVERLLNLDFDILLPGHGQPVIGGASEAARKSLLHRAACIARQGRPKTRPNPSQDLLDCVSGKSPITSPSGQRAKVNVESFEPVFLNYAEIGVSQVIFAEKE